MRPTSRFLALFVLLGLSACGDVRETMGLTSTPPDEFAVIDHPPLSMPPDYALRPPRPGEVSPQAIQPSKQAAQALYGADKMEAVPGKGVTSLSSEMLTPAEQVLVQNTGASSADPTIRRTLDREAGQQVVASRRLIDNILFWREPKVPAAAVVDPVAERQRIEQAKAQNLPVNSGGTPVVDKSGETTVQ